MNLKIAYRERSVNISQVRSQTKRTTQDATHNSAREVEALQKKSLLNNAVIDSENEKHI